MTEDALGAGGKQGDPLPVTPRWTSVFTADYSHKLSRTLTVLLGGSYRYRDAAFSQFAGNPGPSLDPRAPLPVQNLVDLYAGVAHDHLTVRFYGKNVFNNRSYAGLMFMNNPARPNYVPVLPATAGLSLDYQF